MNDYYLSSPPPLSDKSLSSKWLEFPEHWNLCKPAKIEEPQIIAGVLEPETLKEPMGCSRRLARFIAKPLMKVAFFGMEGWREFSFSGLFSAPVTKAKLELWHDIWSVPNVPNDLAQDFNNNRGQSYITSNSAGCEKYVDKLFSTQPEQLFMPTDRQILLAMNYSQIAFYTTVTKDPKTGKHVQFLDMGRLKQHDCFAGYYHNTIGVEHVLETGELSFFSKDGHKISASSEPNLYKLLKFDFMSAATAFFLSIGHSWAHFHWNDIFSALTYNMESKNSTLYKILSVHTRFQLAINSDVLRVDLTPGYNEDTWVGKYLSPVQTIPVDIDNFLYTNSRRTLEFYDERRAEFQCPPNLPDVPYCHIMKKYYKLIRDFVGDINDMDDYFNHDLKRFIKDASHYLPQLEKFDPLDVLATSIWQTAIVHGTDHYSSYKAYRYRPNCPDSTAVEGGSVTATVARMDIRNCTEETSVLEFADQLYCSRFRSFLDTYCRYNDTIGWNLNNLSYNFGVEILDQRATRLISELRELEERLKETPNVFGGKSSLLAPLTQLATSICL